MRKSDYAKMFTLRKDGVYQKFYHGKYLYSKDPEELYKKFLEISTGENFEKKNIEVVANAWSEIHREEITSRTWNNYKPHFENIIARYGKMDVESITAQIISTDLAKYKAMGYSATIVKTRKAIWTQMLDYALVNDYIKFNPAMSVRLPKGLVKGVRTAPTEEEISIVMNSIDAPFGFFPFFLLCTGLRKSEALALLKSDIDLRTRTINITKSLEYSSKSNPRVKEPKTPNSVRVVPIIQILYEELEVYIQNISGEILFSCPQSNRNCGGGYMTDKAYTTAWTKYCNTTGLNLTAHQLRHGTATLMFEAGVDEYTAQSILGHSNITTTMAIYTELRSKQRMKSIEKFDSEMLKYKS